MLLPANALNEGCGCIRQEDGILAQIRKGRLGAMIDTTKGIEKWFTFLHCGTSSDLAVLLSREDYSRLRSFVYDAPGCQLSGNHTNHIFIPTEQAKLSRSAPLDVQHILTSRVVNAFCCCSQIIRSKESIKRGPVLFRHYYLFGEGFARCRLHCFVDKKHALSRLVAGDDTLTLV